MDDEDEPPILSGMSFAALVLILASAIVHAGWNLLGKGTRVDLGSFLIAVVAGALLLTPVLAIWPERLALIPPAVWGLLASTSIWLAAYYIALAQSYRCGHFSTAYPVARALPLVLVTLWTCVAIGDWGRTPFLPFALLIGGCCLLPLRSFAPTLAAEPGERMPLAGWGWVLLTALSTACYSAIDDRAMRLLVQRPGGAVADTFLYAALEMWLTVPLLLAAVLLRRDRAAVLAAAWARRRTAAPVGWGIAVSYLLMLVAMPLVPHVGWTLAFRQASIPIGAVAGMVWLREGASAPKLTGLAMIVGGLAWAAV